MTTPKARALAAVELRNAASIRRGIALHGADSPRRDAMKDAFRDCIRVARFWIAAARLRA